MCVKAGWICLISVKIHPKLMIFSPSTSCQVDRLALTWVAITSGKQLNQGEITISLTYISLVDEV